MNHHARHLFCTLQTLFTTPYQQASFRALLALFLHADGRPHLRHAPHKSASALSRFLNTYTWNARSLIRHTCQQAIQSLLEHYAHQRGRRPRLLVMVDLTSLEKVGHFHELDLVRVLNKKRGVHLVAMYLVAGPLRFPWAFRVGAAKASGAYPSWPSRSCGACPRASRAAFGCWFSQTEGSAASLFSRACMILDWMRWWACGAIVACGMVARSGRFGPGSASPPQACRSR